MSLAEKVYEEVRRLPEPLAKEVLDFVEYLEVKHGLTDRTAEVLKQAQEPSMARVWDNSEDEIWNDL